MDKELRKHVEFLPMKRGTSVSPGCWFRVLGTDKYDRVDDKGYLYEKLVLNLVITDEGAWHHPTPMLTSVPDHMVCPLCGPVDYALLTTAVDVTVYNGQDVEFNDPIQQPGDGPEKQAIRCWCGWCETHYPLSEDLVSNLIKEATSH